MPGPSTPPLMQNPNDAIAQALDKLDEGYSIFTVLYIANQMQCQKHFAAKDAISAGEMAKKYCKATNTRLVHVRPFIVDLELETKKALEIN